MGAHDVGKARSPYTALREVEESQKKEGEMMFTDRRSSRIISSNRRYFCCESVLFCFLNFCFFFIDQKLSLTSKTADYHKRGFIPVVTGADLNIYTALHNNWNAKHEPGLVPASAVERVYAPCDEAKGVTPDGATPLPWCPPPPPTPPAPSPSESYVIFQGVMIPSLSIDIGPVDI